MSAKVFDFFDEVLRQFFGTDVESFARMRRADVEQLLSDDTRRRLTQIQSAAMELGQEAPGDRMHIDAQRLLITPHGLLYAAELSGTSHRPLCYFATPPALFDDIVDGVGATPRQAGWVVAVDRRVARELAFPWPLDAGLRRTLNAEPVLRAA